MSTVRPSLNELGHFIAAIEYEEDWTFELAPGSSGDVFLRVCWRVDDVRGFGKQKLTSVLPIDLYSFAWRECLCELVYEAIDTLESHERLERLKLSGQRIWNPHRTTEFLTRPYPLDFSSPVC